MIFILVSLIACDPPIVIDPKHSVDKFEKYLNMIKTRREVAYKTVENPEIATNADPSHDLPSNHQDYKWEKMYSFPFSFNFTHANWFALKGNAVAPEGYDPNTHLMRFCFPVERNWLAWEYYDDNPAGPEGRMWLNGKGLSAIDEFHDGAVIKEQGPIEVRLFMGRCNGSHTLSRFGIALLHKDTETLYQRIRFLISVIKALDKTNPDIPKLIAVIDSAVRKLDIRNLNLEIDLYDIRNQDPSNKAFYASVSAALATLKEELYKLPKRSEDDPKISVVGYSHIDTTWQWPFNATRFKTTNTATSMLHLMEVPPHDFEGKDAQWRFLATAPQHYKWMKNDAPELFDRVIQSAKDNRWNVDGVMWLEPDTTLPSGESLVRQITMGVRYFKAIDKSFDQHVLFLPDCFGFSASLPQLLRLGGVDAFVTSKISWSEYTEFPYSTFKWKGIDGSFVYSHYITTPSSWSYQTSTYTGTSTAYELIGTYKSYKQKDIINTAALHTSGNGDGGGGITEEMVWNLNMFAELPKIQDVPGIQFPTIDGVFKEIREKDKYLPIWDDELYLEYHRGTLTSQEEIKRLNRQLEAHIHNVEWLCVIINSLDQKKIDVKEYVDIITPMWEDDLLFHFHDALPGTAVNEPYYQIYGMGWPHLEKLRQLETQLTNNLTQLLTSPDTTKKLIVNTLAHDRYLSDQVIPSGGWTYQDASTLINKDKIITQFYHRTFNDSYEMMENYQPFIDTTVQPQVNPDIKFNKETSTVTTPFFTVKFDDKTGNIISCISKKSGQNYIPKDKPGNLFEFYEDRSIQWPAWDIQLYHKEMQLDSPVLTKMEFKDDQILFDYNIKRIGNVKNVAQNTTIHQVVTFSSKEPIIDFRTIVNWTQHDKVLKIAFPTTIRSRNARFGIQFGHIQRPTHNNTERDMAKFEVSGRWADLSESSRGVSIMSDVKAGHDVHDGIMRMTLLKSSMEADRWGDFGTRKFTYRVMFHDGGFIDNSVPQLQDELVYPVTLSEDVSESQGKISSNSEFVKISDPKVILETLKPADDNLNGAFVARFYESTGGARSCKVSFPLLNSNEWDIKVVDLLENELKEKQNQVTKDTETQTLDFKINEINAFEVLTVLITRKTQ